MARTIEVDERILDAIEDTAAFFTGKSGTTFGDDWRDELETLDELWHACCKAVYGTDGTDDLPIVFEPAMALAFVFNQIDYTKEPSED